MHSPAPNDGFTQTKPKGSVQSESWVQDFRHATDPPTDRQSSSGPVHPNPGHWQTRAPQPSVVQYWRQTPAPPHSPSLVQVGPTQ